MKRDDVILHFAMLFICVTLIILLLLFPGVAHEGTDFGLHLFLEALFPYLLPYLILTGWLLRMTAHYTLHPFLLYMKTYLLSAVGGFPTGAATIAQLVKSKELSKEEAALLLGICHCPSPLFTIGFIGMDLLQNTAFAWQYLLLLHTFSLGLLVLFYRRFPHTKKNNNHSLTTQYAFTASLKESMPTVLIVCATIVFFTTIYAVLLHSIHHFFILHDWTRIVLAAVLEMTSGLQFIEKFLNGNFMMFALVVALTAQSFSIHMQVFIIAKSSSIAFRPYIFIRFFYIITIPTLFWILFLV